MGWTKDFNEKRLKNVKENNFCALCKRHVNLKDPFQKETHENGRRHQKNVVFSKIGM